MGIVCSGPSKNLIIPTMSGENGAFTEQVLVRISDDGFTPSDLSLYEGQCILFEWGEESSSEAFNVIQVSGSEMDPVPGGYNSGNLTQTGSFRVQLRKKGLFTFVSESLADGLKMFKVQLLEKPPVEIKITGRGFETQLVKIEEGETVHWRCENEDSEIPCRLQEMEYCFKHGGFIPRKSRIEVESEFERTFHNTGLHFFYLEKYDADRVEGQGSLICIIKVTQRSREFVVRPMEEKLQPELISARVQDRIWLDCSPRKVHGSKILNAYIYRDGFNKNQLVSAKVNGTTESRIADLVSYEFTEPGLYHYVYNMANLLQLRGCVMVQPKPAEHVVPIVDGHFKPGLGTVKQGERVWWILNDKANFTLYLKELESCAPAKHLPRVRGKSSNSGCGCKKAKDQAKLMSWLGVLSHKFEDVGVFTYWLQDDCNSVSPASYCSIVVQKKVKHHAIKVRDQGFTPRILNAHPEDWVWWQWQGTQRPHNILQVSHQRTEIPGGFKSGKAISSAGFFGNIFTELGVFYFASNGLPEVFGAVVITPEPQVHRIHVSSQGLQPDPLIISVNDCVSWMWCDGESYGVQEISHPDDIEEADAVLSSEALGKRCYSKMFSKPGVYHFLCSVRCDSNGELHSQRSDSCVHSVLVDPVSYSCMVGVSTDGFTPPALTVAKSQSVLWTWERQGPEEHNILHVRPPQDDQPFARVRGLSAFDSGPVTTSSTFFHTFDVPGRYFVTSEGTDRKLCVIDIQENAVYVSPPKIPETERNGGNVESGYRVFLECDTPNAEIFYTTDGSYPADCNTELLHYNKKGIVLPQAGFVIIRGIAKKEGCVTSQVFTSNRFWVLQGDYELQEESGEEAEQHVETRSEEGDLKEQIFNWQWYSCRPTISLELVCDNTFNVDITLGSTADVSWIKCFQLYLNGTSYGGWFSQHCRGLVISGLIGGKLYHVVLVAFPTHDSFEPQLSNEVVISCPVQSSLGGPLVSLEASSTPQSVVILWPSLRDPGTEDAVAYSVFINGQPFGEQIIPEPENQYCRVLFESSLENEVYTLCVASHLPGSDLLLYSNEVELSLPIPQEILSALQKAQDVINQSGGDGPDDAALARELLLVAEKMNPGPSPAEESSIVKLSVKSSFGKLQSIPEGGQLDAVVSEAHIMEDAPLQATPGVESEPIPTERSTDVESFDKDEQGGVTDGERFSVFKDEAVGVSANVTFTEAQVEATDAEPVEQQSHSETIDRSDGESVSREPPLVADQETLDTLLHESFQQEKHDCSGNDEAHSDKEDVFDPSVFKDLREVVSEKESLVASPELHAAECPPPISEPGADEGKLQTEHNIEVDPLVLLNEQNDNGSSNQVDEDEVESSNETHQLSQQNGDFSDANGVADKVGNKPENRSTLDSETDTFDEQSDSEFCSEGEKENNEESAKDVRDQSSSENNVTYHAGENDMSGHAPSKNDVSRHAADGNGAGHATCEGDIRAERTNNIDTQVNPSNNPDAVKTVEEHFEEGTYSDQTELFPDDSAAQTGREDGIGECLDKTDGMKSETSVKAENNSETGDLPKASVDSESVTDGSERKVERSAEGSQDAHLVVPTTNLSLEETPASNEFSVSNVFESEAQAEWQSQNLDEAILSETAQELNDPPDEVANESNRPNEDDVVEEETSDNLNESSNSLDGGRDNLSEQILQHASLLVNVVQTSESKPEPEAPTVVTSAKETNNMESLNDAYVLPKEMDENEKTNDDLQEDTWSASSNFGSVKNDGDKTNDAETTEMPTFDGEDPDVDPRLLLPCNVGEGESFKLENVEGSQQRGEKSGASEPKQESDAGSLKETTKDVSEQLLPRPLLVIKGTSSGTVTLEWEWALLPEQIGDWDIVYSVLVLGSKFQTNINSSFCFNYEDSPAKSMWSKPSPANAAYCGLSPRREAAVFAGCFSSQEVILNLRLRCARVIRIKEEDSLQQHVWRTTNTVVEITGLKRRCYYRLAILGQLMPCAIDSLSSVVSFTMPGPPKSPVIHVTDLKHKEVTISWKPSVSFGEATVVGYRLLRNGVVSGEDLDFETLSVTTNDFAEGKDHHFNVIALTGHSVGDSNLSNTVHIHCPTPPKSPQIYDKDSATVGSISIAWKQTEPASTTSPEEQAECSYCVFVNGMLYGEYPLDGETDIFTNEYLFMISNLEIGQKYEVFLKSYLNPRVIDVGRGEKMHICGCYGDSSNVLELFCAGPPSAPIVRVSRIDQSGITLSWSRSREYGAVTLRGYILHVNNRWSGEILPPEQLQSKLTGHKPGDVICVQLAAITNDIPAPLPSPNNQQGDKSRYFPSSYEPPDSGVESSSSFLSGKGSADEVKPYACATGAPLVIQFSNLVKAISSLEVIKFGCSSVSITWSLDDTSDRSVKPDILQALYWKTSDDESSAIKMDVTDNPFCVKGLESGTEYHVILVCYAPHINDDNYNEHPINIAQSQSLAFKTAPPPGPPTNFYVVSATEEIVKLAWDGPAEHDVPVAAIRVNVKKKGNDVPDKGAVFQLLPETRAFTFDRLAPKTEYTFTFEALTEEDLSEMQELSDGSVAFFSAWTNGVDPPEKVNLKSRTPTSIAIKWQPAVVYGLSTIQHYVVHCVPNRQLRRRSRGRMGHAKEAGKELVIGSECCEAELHGLEPGTVYKIVIQAVAGFVDYSYDDDFESDDSDTNSAISSALSEKPPEIHRLHLSPSILVCTAAPPEPPVLLVRGFTATQIQLSWTRPLLLGPVLDSQCAADEDPARGRVRDLKGYRLEVNGRVYARLAPNKTSTTLKKCKSGMKYTCVLVVIIGPEKTDGGQRKNPSNLDTAISDTDTDEERARSLYECFEESSSDAVEITLPRQDWGVSLSAKYCTSKLAGSLRDSPCSETGDEEGGVVVSWSANELSGDVRGYRLVWFSSIHREKNKAFLPGNTNDYEIWPASLSAVYTIYLEIPDVHTEAVAIFGPLHCQTPGPPAPPWIWCRTLSPYHFTVEWNEPVTYGDVNIRAYQVYLNDRRLEKLIDQRQRRVTVHCQSSRPNCTIALMSSYVGASPFPRKRFTIEKKIEPDRSVYRVSLVALGSDPQYGDSAPSNVLRLCTPVAQEWNMGRRPSGQVKRPTFDIKIHVLSTGNTNISYEWTHPSEILDTADHYVIKWSSVLKPQVQELTLPLTQTNHLIDDCLPGTSHFLVVAAVNANGDLVSRSEQYTVQTSAPVEQPSLRLRSCLQSAFTIEWKKPTTFGDAAIDHYKLMANGELQKELEADCTHFEFTDCDPCEEYSFLLKVVSTKPNCDSEWSEPLIVTCPGAETPLITRIQSKQINCIRVGWKTPVLRGAAQVDSYKVYYLQDKGDIVTSEDVVANRQAVQHGSLPWFTEDDKLMPVPPDSYYWVVLQVELLPEDCQPVLSQPVKTRAAVSPDPPLIRLEIEGVEARRRLEERICELLARRDRLHRVVHLLESSVVVKGSRLKDLQVVKATDRMLELDSELADALEDIKAYTGAVSSVLKWSRPRDDGDAVVSGYQVFVDGNPHGKPISESALETHLKLPASCHVIEVQALTDHPVGSSPLSSSVEVSGREFLPFVLFCYLDVHKRGESWPNSGCCSLDDSHSYELKHRDTTAGRLFVPRGILNRRIPCPVFNVMDVFNALWRPLAPVGVKKMVAMLFWTKWCYSSLKILEYFVQFAEEFSDKFSFVTCCVRSDEPVMSHRQSLANTLTEHKWRKTSDSVTHTCGCFSQSQRTRATRRGVINDPDVCQLFGLVGVPTIILLDSSGYISWHGRCSYRDESTFRVFLLHRFSQVSQSNCPVPSCSHCELGEEDERDPSLSDDDDHDNKTSGHHRKTSAELKSLHQRLHGTSRSEDSLTSTRSSTPQREPKKEYIRPKTTSAIGRSARLTGSNRFNESDEPIRVYSHSFSAHGTGYSSRPVTAKSGASATSTRTSKPQRISQSSSSEVSLPVMKQQRGKRTLNTPERGSAPRIKTKISVEDFIHWQNG